MHSLAILIDVKLPFNKWWPLPSHEPVRKRAPEVNPLHIAAVVVSFRLAGSNGKPNAETVWLPSWDVPLSQRLERSGFHLETSDN